MSDACALTSPLPNTAILNELSKLYPNVDSALARIVELKCELRRPKPTIHVISDIHGEFKKLKHVINNASGSLRPIVERIFNGRLSRNESERLLSFLYYPRESFTHHVDTIAHLQQRRDLLREILEQQMLVAADLAQHTRPSYLERVIPAVYLRVFNHIIFTRSDDERKNLLDTLFIEFTEQEKQVDLFRLVSRLVRNLLINELIVAGDLGDRGARVDKVIDYLMRQPKVSITWGNHDASWLGACLGDLTCIATVLRLSLRYRRLSQLEEGYGITMAPLEKLVRTVYSEDPAQRFECKGYGLRDELLMGRMQKAIAIIQFKLEGQAARRNPQFDLEHRCLLHRIDANSGSVEIGETRYQLLDTQFPTLDPADPYRLSSDEQACMDRLQRSFLDSSILWKHMKFVVARGSMYIRRDNALIFHACVPVDESGEFLDFPIDGVMRKGRELFDALGQVVYRVIRERRQQDLDLLWYLWSGPRSPWFGKDKMATFEGYFIADKETHKETKNPYFRLIHERDFCRRILAEFAVDREAGLIVNGHVPVKIEAGESPLKKSAQAVTIDGAFSEAYGDKGYTLVLNSSEIQLALHHHFESVQDAIVSGGDIIPEVSIIKKYPSERLVADTEQGAEIQRQVTLLAQLIDAYRKNQVVEAV